MFKLWLLRNEINISSMKQINTKRKRILELKQLARMETERIKEQIGTVMQMDNERLNESIIHLHRLIKHIRRIEGVS